MSQLFVRRCTTLGGWALWSSLLACGEGPGSPDADAGTDADDAGPAVSPPDIPWLAEGMPAIAAPMLTPCPEGWHEVVEEGPPGGVATVTCDPFGDDPTSEPDTCPDGWAHFAGDPGCAPVGAPCPAGDFPEGLPTDAEVLYVLSSAPPGGDGSQGAPLSTIDAALSAASPGTVIAIGKGDYGEPVRVYRGVTLWGACAAQRRRGG